MKFRLFAFVCACLFVPAGFAAANPGGPAISTDPEPFQVTSKTEVPNATLQPGSYSIRILDHLRDRVILQVSGKGARVESTFLAIPAATMSNAPAGPIAYGAGPKGKAALKGFAFSGGLAVEFVYPKDDAVSIAQANGTRVMAIDPASEGRVAAPKLKQDDMEMITLWMLEPSRVGPDDKKPGIAATRYQAPPAANSAPVETAGTSSAPVDSPAPSYAATTQTASTSTVGTRPSVARHSRPVQLAQNDVPPPPAPSRTHTRPANVTSLPHTGSNLPVLGLAAFLSILLGGFLSLRRLSA